MDYPRLDLIQKKLTTEYSGRNMIYFKKISSTSNFAFSLASEAAQHNLKNTINKVTLEGTVVISEKQSGGRGRFDRKWISPEGGLWFTLINHPEIAIKDMAKLTVIAAAAVVGTLKNILENMDADTQMLAVKWPNDIYFSGKKLAGILCETESFNGNTYLFTGIGINVNFSAKTSMFSGLNAVSLFDITAKKTDRNMLLAEIINNYEKNYEYFKKSKDLHKIFAKIEKIITL